LISLSLSLSAAPAFHLVRVILGNENSFILGLAQSLLGKDQGFSNWKGVSWSSMVISPVMFLTLVVLTSWSLLPVANGGALV
jgi:hypothetical protein